MNLVSIETPTARVTATGEELELLDAPLRIVAAGQLLQVIADKLIETLAEGIGLLSGASDKLLVDRQGHVHSHSICAHVSCVNRGRLLLGATPDSLLNYLPVYVTTYPSSMRLSASSILTSRLTASPMRLWASNSALKRSRPASKRRPGRKRRQDRRGRKSVAAPGRMASWRWLVELFIFARFHAAAGNESAVAEALGNVLGPSREEAGCLSINTFRSIRDPRLFYIHSRWTNEAAFDNHAKLPHTVRFIERVESLLDHPLDVTRAEVIG